MDDSSESISDFDPNLNTDGIFDDSYAVSEEFLDDNLQYDKVPEIKEGVLDMLNIYGGEYMDPHVRTHIDKFESLLETALTTVNELGVDMFRLPPAEDSVIAAFDAVDEFTYVNELPELSIRKLIEYLGFCEQVFFGEPRCPPTKWSRGIRRTLEGMVDNWKRWLDHSITTHPRLKQIISEKVLILDVYLTGSARFDNTPHDPDIDY